MELHIVSITSKGKKVDKLYTSDNLKKTLKTIELMFKMKMYRSYKVFDNSNNKLLLDLH